MSFGEVGKAKLLRRDFSIPAFLAVKGGGGEVGRRVKAEGKERSEKYLAPGILNYKK